MRALAFRIKNIRAVLRKIDSKATPCPAWGWGSPILPPAVNRRDLSFYVEDRLNQKMWDQRNGEIERARKLL